MGKNARSAAGRGSPTLTLVSDVAAMSDAGVVVIGAGQAGLAVSHELTSAGVQHVVLERDRVASAWRRRWDSFTLVLPNWTIRLPGGGSYSGDDPDGYLARDAVVAHFEDYARDAPVHEGVGVTALGPGSDGGFLLRTTAGEITARAVVVCSGSFDRPVRPAAVAGLPPSVQVLDAIDYRNPGDLAPDGVVVVVGSGQTGCQLAEELHLAGRDVVLACGRAPWMPRRLGGRDIVHALEDSGFFDMPRSALPAPAARFVPSPQATGRDGGHDLHYRTLQDLGVRLAGRLAGADGSRVGFADDLAASVAFGDARWADLSALISTQFPRRALPVPELPVPPPFHAPELESIATSDIASVVITSGYRPGYAAWVDFPVFDDLGFPATENGSTDVPGLYFCGAHFQRVRKSGILLGVGEDAELVGAAVTAGPR